MSKRKNSPGGGLIGGIIGGANIGTIVMMVVTGYSDRLNPVDHPILSTLGLSFPVFLFLNLLFLVFWLFFRKRGAWIPIIGMLLAYGPVRTYCPVNFSPEHPDSCIQILSFNTNNFGAGYHEGEVQMDLVNYIARSQADIVCLQESQLGRAEIDAVLDSAYAYHDSILTPRYLKADVSVIYSKYPIIKKQLIPYASRGNCSGAFFLKIDGDTVIVINNHLETTGLSNTVGDGFKKMIKGDENINQSRHTSRLILSQLAQSCKIRGPQADSVHAFIERHRRYPLIVCGDFNDSPISYAHRTIGRGLTDCYVTTATGPGISYHLNGFFVRIDHIFCNRFFKPYECRVDTKMKDSDHYPIRCWLKKQRK
ncbi:MAG: endonuclease/exonuclease/phosphatase family protein [Prevotella sp.]|uniref:endonuclease/exonuclease/phosphatase family protein n=1 Tax=Prevotella sp. AGR2160 TaxID=1280674 RepID=UPI0004120382|nr:endonuclease/exonuclease/phosphatase family protein [Prevotella sp. AGR2160]MDD5862517.1 endonuclease/exonuclease/phosphatase family protein [Prevotella sp.]